MDLIFGLLYNVLQPLGGRAGLVNEAFTFLFDFHKFIYGDDCGWHNHLLTALHVNYAAINRNNNKPEETLKAYKNAFVHAKRFAEFAEGTNKPNTSPFTDQLKQNAKDNDPHSEVQRVWESLKKDETQTLLGDNDDFIALFKEVETWLAEK